ncbi:MAG: hypothetical protein JEZ07_17090 [Phycisphaerae bacterium]|nr:hypothetical protein [Phycisphaerae bacterium]
MARKKSELVLKQWKYWLNIFGNGRAVVSLRWIIAASMVWPNSNFQMEVKDC